MKKLFIFASVFLAVHVVSAMDIEQSKLRSNTNFEDAFNTRSVTTVEGNICIVPSDPVYTLNGELPSKPQSISNLLEKKVDSNEPLQKVLIWGTNTTSFSLYLPISLLQDVKEKQKKRIMINRNSYKLTANQLDSKYSNLGNFQSALAWYKKMFIQNPIYFTDDEKELLNQNILVKNAFGITHGKDGWPQAQTLSVKAKRNAGKLSFLGLAAIGATCVAWWKGYLPTTSLFGGLGKWFGL